MTVVYIETPKVAHSAMYEERMKAMGSRWNQEKNHKKRADFGEKMAPSYFVLL